MDFNVAGLIWLMTGICCFILEMTLPGFIIFFFGVGAWIVALTCWLYPVSLNVQLAIFLVTSLLSLFLLRNLLKRVFLGTVSDEDKVGVRPGEKAKVIEDISPPADGKISYSGTQWRAIAEEPIAKGTTVTIVSQDGLTMKVKAED